MADYYPLIARAVAGLEKNTGDARRTLYERARTALVDQLRGVSPALSESDVTRERLALEEAIRKVEAEAARHMKITPPPPRVRAPAPERWEAARAPLAPPAPVADEEPSAPRRTVPPQPPRRPAMPGTRQASQAASAAAAEPQFSESFY